MGRIALVRCVLVLRWSGYHTTPAKPRRNTTHIVPEQYNPWNNSTNKSQAPEDGYINVRNMLSIKWHQVGLSLFNYQDDARPNKHKVSLFLVCQTSSLVYTFTLHAFFFSQLAHSSNSSNFIVVILQKYILYVRRSILFHKNVLLWRSYARSSRLSAFLTCISYVSGPNNWVFWPRYIFQPSKMCPQAYSSSNSAL
jgi:hypothetical protein